MPLPIDDDNIVMIERNGKPTLATPEDSIKFLKLIGETILENLDKIDCSKCGYKMDKCICNVECCPDCGFNECACPPTKADDPFDFVDWD